jgi:hypothetical protein
LTRLSLGGSFKAMNGDHVRCLCPARFRDSGAAPGVIEAFGLFMRIGELVSCDVKLYSVLLGWMRILTKPCVSPRVPHESMRLSGGDREITTGRGMKLPGNVANLAASNRGSARVGEYG